MILSFTSILLEKNQHSVFSHSLVSSWLHFLWKYETISALDFKKELLYHEAFVVDRFSIFCGEQGTLFFFWEQSHIRLEHLALGGRTAWPTFRLELTKNWAPISPHIYISHPCWLTLISTAGSSKSKVPKHSVFLHPSNHRSFHDFAWILSFLSLVLLFRWTYLHRLFFKLWLL